MSLQTVLRTDLYDSGRHSTPGLTVLGNFWFMTTPNDSSESLCFWVFTSPNGRKRQELPHWSSVSVRPCTSLPGCVERTGALALSCYPPLSSAEADSWRQYPAPSHLWEELCNDIVRIIAAETGTGSAQDQMEQGWAADHLTSSVFIKWC